MINEILNVQIFKIKYKKIRQFLLLIKLYQN